MIGRALQKNVSQVGATTNTPIVSQHGVEMRRPTSVLEADFVEPNMGGTMPNMTGAGYFFSSIEDGGVCYLFHILYAFYMQCIDHFWTVWRCLKYEDSLSSPRMQQNDVWTQPIKCQENLAIWHILVSSTLCTSALNFTLQVSGQLRSFAKNGECIS